MHNWADTFFKGRRVDNPIDTGDGTLNLKNIAKAFDLDHYLISNTNNLDSVLKKVIKIYNGSMLQTSEDSLYGLSDSR